MFLDLFGRVTNTMSCSEDYISSYNDACAGKSSKLYGMDVFAYTVLCLAHISPLYDSQPSNVMTVLLPLMASKGTPLSRGVMIPLLLDENPNTKSERRLKIRLCTWMHSDL